MATQGAGGGGGQHNKFFKVLLPGSFELRLSIPPKFAAAGLGAWHDRPWRGAKLRDGAGRWWDVDLHRDGDDRRVSFTGSGWRAFVSANAISAGQLLVFEHHRDDHHHFAVDIFDASGCCFLDGLVDSTGVAGDILNPKRRKLPPPTRRSSTTNVGADELCRRIETPYQLRLLDVSKSFCDRLGWTSSRDVHLMLCAAAADNRIWPVSVRVSAKSAMMCAGWAEFAQDNGLAISDACLFLPLEASHGGALQVRVIRSTSTSTSGSA